MQVKAGSGHRAHAGQGGHAFWRGQLAASGHFGHTGGTMLDFKIYKPSSPRAISLCLTSIPSFILNPKSDTTITANNKRKSDAKLSFII